MASHDTQPTASELPPPPLEEPTGKTLEAVYTVNCTAKEHKATATEYYKEGNKIDAKAYSSKKEALYELKNRVLVQLLPHADQIQKHRISGQRFYCPYFAEFSFHVPAERASIPDSKLTQSRSVRNLNTDVRSQSSSLDIGESLAHLRKTFDHNANEFLPVTHLWYGTTRRFLGWDVLPLPDRANNSTN